MSSYTVVQFSDLVGKTITSVTGQINSEELFIICSDGSEYKMYHRQDCCEHVRVEEIVGDLNDLLNSPILMAEEATNREDARPYNSVTWTYYKLATIKGYVTIRWLGESNGYYSEEVDFIKVNEKHHTGEIYFIK